MTLPYYQVATDLIGPKSTLIAAKLKVHRQRALGMGMDLIAFAVEATSTKEKPPDGLFHDADAASILEGAMQWDGAQGKAFEAFVSAGVIEPLQVGARVRGTDRYKATWAKNTRPGPGGRPDGNRPETVRKPRGVRTATGREKEREIEKEETKEERHPAPAVAAPPSPGFLKEAWNTNRPPPLPEWQDMTPKREKAARARLKEKPDTAYWLAVVARIQASPFCLGHNDRGWVAGPDWLLQPDTATKVLEGKYDDRRAHKPPADTRGIPPPAEQRPGCEAPRCRRSGDATTWTGHWLCYGHMGQWDEGFHGGRAETAEEWAGFLASLEAQPGASP